MSSAKAPTPRPRLSELVVLDNFRVLLRKIEVIDTDTGIIVAGALWKYYDSDPCA